MDKIGGTIVTIDIGTSKVSLIVSKVNKFNKLEVVHIETKKVDAVVKGEIIEPYKIAEIIKASLPQIEEKYGLKIKSSYANINNKFVTIEEIEQSIDIDEKLAIVQKYDVDKLLNKAKQLPVSSDQKIIDIIPVEYYDENKNLIQNPINFKCKKIIGKYQIVIGMRSYLEKIEAIFQYAGIKLDGVILQCISDSKLVLTPEQRNKGTLLIDVGGTNTDISLYINDRLIYIENIDLGSDNITKDIAAGLDLSLQEAEKIKKQYALALKNLIENDYQVNVIDKNNKSKKIKCSEIVEIIEARCEEILKEIDNAITDIEAKKYVKEIVFIGQGFNTISKIEILAKEILDRPIKLVNFKQTNQIRNVNTTAYSMQEYVLNNKNNINNKLSNVEDIDFNQKNGIISKMVEKIKDFLYT